jgi:hypothetical protein
MKLETTFIALLVLASACSGTKPAQPDAVATCPECQCDAGVCPEGQSCQIDDGDPDPTPACGNCFWNKNTGHLSLLMQKRVLSQSEPRHTWTINSVDVTYPGLAPTSHPVRADGGLAFINEADASCATTLNLYANPSGLRDAPISTISLTLSGDGGTMPIPFKRKCVKLGTDAGVFELQGDCKCCNSCLACSDVAGDYPACN